jgi:hypothetical protein
LSAASAERKPPAAVEDDGRRLVGDERLDVALEHAAPDVARAGSPVDLPLVVFPHVDELEPLAAVEPRLDVGDRALPHARAFASSTIARNPGLCFIAPRLAFDT